MVPRVEAWEAALNGGGEPSWGIWMVLEARYGIGGKIPALLPGVFTLPNADFIDPNQVSAPVCRDLF